MLSLRRDRSPLLHLRPKADLYPILRNLSADGGSFVIDEVMVVASPVVYHWQCCPPHLYVRWRIDRKIWNQGPVTCDWVWTYGLPLKVWYNRFVTTDRCLPLPFKAVMCSDRIVVSRLVVSVGNLPKTSKHSIKVVFSASSYSLESVSQNGRSWHSMTTLERDPDSRVPYCYS